MCLLWIHVYGVSWCLQCLRNTTTYVFYYKRTYPHHDYKETNNWIPTLRSWYLDLQRQFIYKQMIKILLRFRFINFGGIDNHQLFFHNLYILKFAIWHLLALTWKPKDSVRNSRSSDRQGVITGNGIGIRFRSNINNAKVPMIVYLKSFIFIAILRGNLGKSTHKTWKE
jgi:hypothetical protein